MALVACFALPTPSLAATKKDWDGNGHGVPPWAGVGFDLSERDAALVLAPH